MSDKRNPRVEERMNDIHYHVKCPNCKLHINIESWDDLFENKNVEAYGLHKYYNIVAGKINTVIWIFRDILIGGHWSSENPDWLNIITSRRHIHMPYKLVKFVLPTLPYIDYPYMGCIMNKCKKCEHVWLSSDSRDNIITVEDENGEEET